MKCDNYSAVTLICTAYKILANMLYVQLVTYAEEIIWEHQRDFPSGRNTVDQIFNMRPTLQKCLEQNMDVHHLFIFQQCITLYGGGKEVKYIN